MTKSRAQTYKVMTDSDIYKEYGELVNSYDKWIKKEFWLHEADEPEILQIFTIREELHFLIEESMVRKINIDVAETKTLDETWQKWLIAHKVRGFSWPRKKPLPPRTQWWGWIDQLESLTEEERSTL